MYVFSGFTAVTAMLALSVDAQTLPLPSQDPFYTQPANISLYKPGDVIKSRSISTTLQGANVGPFFNFQVKSATQFQYRTTDSLSNPVAAVMTFLVPNTSNANSSNLLAYSVAYDAANNNCSPSYSLRPGANNTVGSDATTIQAALNNGWYVVTSDYEGLQAQFVAGIQAGHGVLDSIRASFNRTALALTGLSPDAHYAMFGYSGGSLASEWAAELAPSYAPDLKRFVGTAIGGLTPNVTKVLLTVTGTFPSTGGEGLAFAATLGLSKAYANLSTFIDQQLLPAKREQFFTIANECISNNMGAFGNYFSYFQSGRAIVSSDVWATVTSGAGQQGVHGIPKQPLFVYKAIGDEVSPVADTDELVNKYCLDGVTIQYQRNTFGGHILEAYLGTPAAYMWLQDRFNGVPIDQVNNFHNCETQNVTIISTDSTGAGSIFGPQLAATWKNESQTNNVSFAY